MRTAEGQIWLDGTLLPIGEAQVPLVLPALQSGVGVFETVAVRDGRPVEAAEHDVRLRQGAEVLGIVLPATTVLRSAMEQIAGQVADGYGWLKIVALRDGPCAVYGGSMDRAEEGRPVTAILLPWRRSIRDPLAGIKSLSYAALLLGTEEAQRRGADEGLWLNSRGHLAEGSSSNLFVVRHRRVFTPGVGDGILAGITRERALQAARELKLTIHEGKLRVKRLQIADEAFLTSSLRGVRPLVRFEGRAIGSGEPGPVTRAIAQQMSKTKEPTENRTTTAASGGRRT